MRSEIARLISAASDFLDKFSDIPDESLKLETLRNVTNALSLISSDAEKSSELSNERQ